MATTSLLATLLLAGAITGAGPVVADTPGELPSAGAAVSFRDGDRQVEARYAGPGSRGRRPVSLHYPGLGVTVPATVGAEAIVQLRPGVDAGSALAAAGLVPVRQLMPSLRLFLVRDAAGADGLALASRLAPGPGAGPLLAAIPDLAFALRAAAGRDGPPDDPRYGGQWYLAKIGIEGAWAIETGSPTVKVAVVDTGCDLVHPDLITKLEPGRDVVSGDDDPTPTAGSGAEHGTACAGIIGAEADNGLGISGACPGCRLSCIRMLPADGEPQPLSADIDAFEFALASDAAIVSNSWGFVDSIPVPRLLAAAIEEVHDNGRGGLGAMVIFAAGNDGHEVADFELLAVRGVIGVGALNNYDEATSFTNFGNSVDLCAPTGTLTTDLSGPAGADPGDYTSTFGGTSSACPLVAGVAGLLISAAPELTSAELDAILVETVRAAPYAQPDAAGHDPIYGFGIVDPERALRRALRLPEDGGGGAGGAGGTGEGGSGGGGGAGGESGAGPGGAGPGGDGGGGGVAPTGPGGGPAPDDEGSGDDAGGCGCSSGSGPSLFLLAAAALLLLPGPRRRSSPGAPDA